MPDTRSIPTSDERSRRLIEQYNEIAELAGRLAHEIKNPLSTMGLHLQLLAEDFGDSPEQRSQRALRKIRIIQTECVRLEHILNDFLRFARLKDLRLKQTALNNFVEAMVDFFGPQAANRKVLVRSYLAPGLPPVRVDEDYFRQALFNLVVNAQDAMPDGGELIFQTGHDGSTVWLEIIDTGQGIDRELQGDVFRPFFTTRKDGSGLGLPTARKIIEAHGGSIRVESEVGKGTRFRIELPAGDAPRGEPGNGPSGPAP